jgi:hypothetical protein
MLSLRNVFLTSAVVVGVAVAGAAQLEHKPSKKDKHVAAHKLLGHRLHSNGKHLLHQTGRGHKASVNVDNGKITGLDVQPAPKEIKKYKSQTLPGIADIYVWYGYAVTDWYGDTYIYWFPADIVYDPFIDADVYILDFGY